MPANRTQQLTKIPSSWNFGQITNTPINNDLWFPWLLMRPQAAFIMSKLYNKWLLRYVKCRNFNAQLTWWSRNKPCTARWCCISLQNKCNFWNKIKKIFADKLTKCCFGFGEIVSVSIMFNLWEHYNFHLHLKFKFFTLIVQCVAKKTGILFTS
jgi:hypothetical protein